MRLPVLGGKASQTAAAQSGYRMPQSAKKAECAQSGVCPPMSDYDAALTVPGAQNVAVGPGGKTVAPGRSQREVFRRLFSIVVAAR